MGKEDRKGGEVNDKWKWNLNAQSFVPSSASAPASASAAPDIFESLPDDLTDALQEATLGFDDDDDGYVDDDCDDNAGMLQMPSPYAAFIGGDVISDINGAHGEDEDDEKDDDGPEFAILRSEFPHYSLESLRAVLEANDGNVEMATDVLAQLELEGAAALASSSQPPPMVPIPQAPAPAFNEMNFPSLGVQLSQSQSQDNSNPSSSSLAFEYSKVLQTRKAPPPVSSDGSRQQNMPAQPQRHPHPHQQGYKGAGGSQVKWVDTGASVSENYHDSRSLAMEHMRARNVCFEQATRAYLAGNKAMASKLSKKGQFHDEQMRTEHSQASRQIFQKRNPNHHSIATPSSSTEPRVIDLHGLHVREATEFVRDAVAQLRCSKVKGQRVNILVGTAHHTKARHSAVGLKEAIEGLLSETGVPFHYEAPGMMQISNT